MTRTVPMLLKAYDHAAAELLLLAAKTVPDSDGPRARALTEAAIAILAGPVVEDFARHAGRHLRALDHVLDNPQGMAAADALLVRRARMALQGLKIRHATRCRQAVSPVERALKVGVHDAVAIDLLRAAIRISGTGGALRAGTMKTVALSILQGPVDLAFDRRAADQVKALDYILQNVSGETEDDVLSIRAARKVLIDLRARAALRGSGLGRPDPIPRKRLRRTQ